MTLRELISKLLSKADLDAEIYFCEKSEVDGNGNNDKKVVDVKVENESCVLFIIEDFPE